MNCRRSERSEPMGSGGEFKILAAHLRHGLGPAVHDREGAVHARRLGDGGRFRLRNLLTAFVKRLDAGRQGDSHGC